MILLTFAFLLCLESQAMARLVPAPDAGSSGLLLGMAFAGIILVRNFLGKKGRHFVDPRPSSLHHRFPCLPVNRLLLGADAMAYRRIVRFSDHGFA